MRHQIEDYLRDHAGINPEIGQAGRKGDRAAFQLPKA
jgi:hypothetical protein